LKRALALVSCDVVVGVSSTAMEGARGHAYTSCKLMQFLDAIRQKVKPGITVLQDLGIVDINHSSLSPSGRNLAFETKCAMRIFPGSRRQRPSALTLGGTVKAMHAELLKQAPVADEPAPD